MNNRSIGRAQVKYPPKLLIAGMMPVTFDLPFDTLKVLRSFKGVTSLIKMTVGALDFHGLVDLSRNFGFEIRPVFFAPEHQGWLGYSLSFLDFAKDRQFDYGAEGLFLDNTADLELKNFCDALSNPPQFQITPFIFEPVDEKDFTFSLFSLGCVSKVKINLPDNSLEPSWGLSNEQLRSFSNRLLSTFYNPG
jgi:hypothetical protein